MLTININTDLVKQKGEQFARALFNKIQTELQYEGELLVKHARELPPFESYNDQTGNLRSSIGYATFANHRQTNQSHFDTVKDGKDGPQAGEKALTAHEDKIRAYSHALLVVAGMEYASYVEKVENKNVLAKTELKAAQDMVDILSNLKKTFQV